MRRGFLPGLRLSSVPVLFASAVLIADGLYLFWPQVRCMVGFVEDPCPLDLSRAVGEIVTIAAGVLLPWMAPVLFDGTAENDA